MHCLRVDHGAEHIDCRLVYERRDRADIVGRETMLTQYLLQCVGRRMCVSTCRMELKRGLGKRPARAETII